MDFRYTVSQFDPVAASSQKTSFLGKAKMALLMSGMFTMVFFPSYAVTMFYGAVIASLGSAITYLRKLPLLTVRSPD